MSDQFWVNVDEGVDFLFLLDLDEKRDFGRSEKDIVEKAKFLDFRERNG